MTRQNPISVYESTDWLKRTVWAWSCDVHPQGRGLHRYDRMIDRIRSRRDKPPEPHPWRRAMDAAVLHYHRYHSVCSCAARNAPVMSDSGAGSDPAPRAEPSLVQITPGNGSTQ